MADLGLEQNPDLIGEMLHGVEVEPALKEAMLYAPDLGYLALEADAGIQVLGFHTPTTDTRGRLPAIIAPKVQLGDYPRSEQNIATHGKGVGPRLYNTLQGTRGLPGGPRPVGLYAVGYTPETTILDTRHDSDKTMVGKAVRIARHAGRIAKSRVIGIENTVNKIHRPYGSADLVLINEPPAAARRRLKRTPEDELGPNVDSSFIIVRNEEHTLRLVGEAQLGYVT